jgi:hypothetical protein
MATNNGLTPQGRSSSALRAVLRLFCVIPLLTGLGDVIQGARFLSAAGAQVPAESLTNAALNSQLMFAGAIWFGYAPLIWYATSNLSERSLLLRMLFSLIFLSGLARLFALYRYASPGTILVGATVIELLLPPIVVIWSLRVNE